MNIELRQYQKDSIEAAWLSLEQTPGGTVIALPTGTGKSVVAAELVRQALTRWPGYRGRVLILAGSRELVAQNAAEFQALAPGVGCGIYSASLGRRETDQDVIHAQIQSVHRLDPSIWGARSLVLIDECHQIPFESDSMYRRLLDGLVALNPGLRCIGLSATPWRLNTGSVVGPADEGFVFQSLAYELSLRSAIEQGYLAPLVPCPVPAHLHADLSGVAIRAGEFVAGQAEQAMLRDGLVQRTIDDLLIRAKEAKCGLIFASGVQHCSEVLDALHARGEKATMILGDTHSDVRDWAVDEHRRGLCRWLVNCGTLTTGYNCKPVDAVVLLRPTASSGLLLQMLGRGTRLSPETGKQACGVYDYARNLSRHGPVDLIQPRNRRPGQGNGREDQEAPMKQCGNCGQRVHARHQFCPFCSEVFPLTPAHEDTPDDSPIFSGARSDSYTVARVAYSRHIKRDDGSGRPRYATMRVDYFQNDGTYLSSITPVVSEYVCFSHPAGNFARTKAEQWWRLRADSAVPENTEVALASIGEIRTPSKITVFRKDEKSFPEIKRVQFGEPTIPKQDLADLPF